jgi:hypothetical protein
VKILTAQEIPKDLLQRSKDLLCKWRVLYDEGDGEEEIARELWALFPGSKETGEEEITEEMMAAGVYAFQTTLDFSEPLLTSEEVVLSVYRAMVAASPRK